MYKPKRSINLNLTKTFSPNTPRTLRPPYPCCIDNDHGGRNDLRIRFLESGLRETKATDYLLFLPCMSRLG